MRPRSFEIPTDVIVTSLPRIKPTWSPASSRNIFAALTLTVKRLRFLSTPELVEVDAEAPFEQDVEYP